MPWLQVTRSAGTSGLALPGQSKVAGTAWPPGAMAALGVVCLLLGAASWPSASALGEEFWPGQSAADILSGAASRRRYARVRAFGGARGAGRRTRPLDTRGSPAVGRREGQARGSRGPDSEVERAGSDESPAVLLARNPVSTRMLGVPCSERGPCASCGRRTDPVRAGCGDGRPAPPGRAVTFIGSSGGCGGRQRREGCPRRGSLLWTGRRFSACVRDP